MNILPFNGYKPVIEEGSFIAPTAVIVGNVHIKAGASIWFGAVLRGDLGKIVIESRARIQDRVVVHTLPGGETVVEEEASVAHGSVLYNCVVQRGSIIGTKSTVLEFSKIGEGTLLAAGSVVRKNTFIPPNCLALGNPAKAKKKLTGSSLWYIQQSTEVYNLLRDNYLQQSKRDD